MLEFEVGKLTIQATPDNIKIIDSYKITNKKEMKKIVNEIIEKAPIFKSKRSTRSMVREWRSHNRCYNRGWFTRHTKDCDLESKETIFMRIIYFIGGI